LRTGFLGQCQWRYRRAAAGLSTAGRAAWLTRV
jgi:hypothetical protein